MLSPGRSGFTLVEILVVLAVGVLIAAVVVPTLMGGLDQSRVEASGESLRGIGEAVGAMWDDVGQYPGRLSHLSAPIAAADLDLCGSTYGGASADWTGPYLNRAVPTTGLPVPIGTASNTLTYTEVPPLLWVTVQSVAHGDARALNAQLDADADSAGGAIRWGPVSGSGLVDLYYVRPVRAC